MIGGAHDFLKWPRNSARFTRCFRYLWVMVGCPVFRPNLGRGYPAAAHGRPSSHSHHSHSPRHHSTSLRGVSMWWTGWMGPRCGRHPKWGPWAVGRENVEAANSGVSDVYEYWMLVKNECSSILNIHKYSMYIPYVFVCLGAYSNAQHTYNKINVWVDICTNLTRGLMRA